MPKVRVRSGKEGREEEDMYEIPIFFFQCNLLLVFNKCQM